MANEPKGFFFNVGRALGSLRLFHVFLVLVILGIAAYAMYRGGVFNGNEAKAPEPGKAAVEPARPADTLEKGVEAPDAASITTVKEYSFRPAERLPEVKGISAYKPLVENTVRFALNVWAGWGPIILANEGFKPGHLWKAPDGQEFKVELVLIDNPVQMINAYAAGEIHIGWATLDMIPLFLQSGLVDSSGKPKDSRAMPRVFQQIDWSNGGDGIVVRESIKTVTDLRGKKLVLAQNSPSHYFALNMLVSGGIQPSGVNMIFTDDAFQAAAAFNAQKDIAGAVSWAPDIYNLEKVKGNRMLVTTATANKLIADVWFARADFAKDHSSLCEALVRGIFEAMEDLKSESKKNRCAELMAQGYNIPASETRKMFGDAHNTNWQENYQFFLNQNNPTNFERVWGQAYYLYRQIRAITHAPVPFDQVMDFTLIEALGKEPKYSSQKDEYQIALVPKTIGEIKAESEEILTNTVIIHFFPNSWDLRKKVMKTVGTKDMEVLYDPNIESILEGIGKLSGQFGGARILIEGHTDGSLKGQVGSSLVKELSLRRATAVKEAILERFKLDPNQFSVDGLGWDRPADINDAMNHAKNRRVEVKIYWAERP
jgi:ABC-type nitrate/sulfonate/bicarbonate transport system substrate-binding protein